jgi:hypothetical protein
MKNSPMVPVKGITMFFVPVYEEVYVTSEQSAILWRFFIIARSSSQSVVFRVLAHSSSLSNALSSIRSLCSPPISSHRHSFSLRKYKTVSLTSNYHLEVIAHSDWARESELRKTRLSGLIGASAGLLGLLSGLIGGFWGLIGLSAGAIGLFSGLIGLASDSDGLSSGLIGLSSGVISLSAGLLGMSSYLRDLLSDFGDLSSARVACQRARSASSQA